jgi:hypothetical protein
MLSDVSDGGHAVSIVDRRQLNGLEYAEKCKVSRPERTTAEHGNDGAGYRCQVSLK